MISSRLPSPTQEGASAGELIVETGDKASPTWSCDVGIQIADNLYPVGNPAVDSFGNVYATFSGPPPYLAAMRSMKAAQSSAIAALPIWTTFSALLSPLCDRLKLPAYT